MYTVFGLTRDPFSPLCDGALYWENAEREAARRFAKELLRSGTGIWVSGPPGSGRSALLCRVAEEIAQEGRRVLWTEPVVTCSPEELLAKLLGAVSESPPPLGLLGLAEALYGPLLDGFYRSGTVVCFPGLEEPTVGSLAEAAILSRFRVAGRPILTLALIGEGDPPFSGLERVSLPAPNPADLEACLRHRAAACGNPGLLPGDAFAKVAAASKGFGEALARARQAMAREAFLSARPSPAPHSAQVPDPWGGVGEERPSVLDPAELDELSGLLESLSSRR